MDSVVFFKYIMLEGKVGRRIGKGYMGGKFDQSTLPTYINSQTIKTIVKKK